MQLLKVSPKTNKQTTQGSELPGSRNKEGNRKFAQEIDSFACHRELRKNVILYHQLHSCDFLLTASCTTLAQCLTCKCSVNILADFLWVLIKRIM